MQFKFGADPMGRYEDICARAETGSRQVPSIENRVVAGEVWKMTAIPFFDMDGFGVHEPNSVEIRLALLGDPDLHTDRQTDRQLSFIYIEMDTYSNKYDTHNNIDIVTIRNINKHN